MNKLDTDYKSLLNDILSYGVTKKDRTGTGTVSVFGRTIRHKMSAGFPILTTKKIPFRLVATELIWFLRGDTNLKYLVDNGCNIWVGDAYKKYKQEWMKENPPMSGPYEDKCLTEEEFIEKIKTDNEFAKVHGDLGPIYGKQWRKWQGWMQYKKEDGSTGFGSLWYDQIAQLIHQLRTNPDSRRLMVSAWNPADIGAMTLPPCHYGFQCYTRELSDDERAKLMDKIYGIKKPEDRTLPWLRKDIDEANVPTRAISLMYNIRSSDVFLGLPFNIASYGLLLSILAKAVNMVPDELIGNLGDTHLYLNHLDAAKIQMERSSFELPELEHMKTNSFYESLSGADDLSLIGHLDPNDFKLKNYQSHPAIKAPLSN